ncbi:MAG: hypothetical protein QGI45_08235 [Myxococcota bacterium]|jgi:hypothetical protein|nr:hypothetical protein [Myxococcota bacterium]
MLKKIFMISLPFMLVACGMEYEGELVSYSALEDEAGIESMSDYDLKGKRAAEIDRADVEGEGDGDGEGMPDTKDYEVCMRYCMEDYSDFDICEAKCFKHSDAAKRDN